MSGSSFPKSNYSSFTVTLTAIDSCKDLEKLFLLMNKRRHSFCLQRQRVREEKKLLSSLYAIYGQVFLKASQSVGTDYKKQKDSDTHTNNSLIKKYRNVKTC